MIPIATIFMRQKANCASYTAQFYLVHLLREKLVASKSRIVFVSSGAVTSVSDTSKLPLSRELTAQDMIWFADTLVLKTGGLGMP